ncbi:MAG: PGDYG domain-containing protein [Betaproteobacteria bacterium]
MQPDLTIDTMAAQYTKDEIVDVVFSDHEGSLQSREGPNRFCIGDALITGSTGDRWTVSRDRFDVKYEALAVNASDPVRYRAKRVAVWARQMDTPFSIARSAGGDVLTGSVDDWLLQYAPGDYGVVENARFQQVYRRISVSDNETNPQQR